MASKVVVTPDRLPDAVRAILDSYSADIIRLSKDVVRETTREAAKEVRKAGDYQNRTREYRSSIRAKITENSMGAEGLVYASGGQYALTHLLENGHKLHQAPLVKTRAFPHWKNGEEIAKEAEKKLIERISNGK